MLGTSPVGGECIGHCMCALSCPDTLIGLGMSTYIGGLAVYIAGDYVCDMGKDGVFFVLKVI